MINLKYIKKATIKDVEEVIANIREPDEQEILAMGLEVDHALRFSFDNSAECYAIHKNGKVYGVFGMVDGSGSLNEVYMPWAFFTADIEEHVVQFNRSTKKVLKHWFEKYGTLRNHVSVRNKRTVMWLKWHGFKFEPPVTFGLFGRHFYPFMMGEL